jgi:hypothetical protein
VAWALSIPNVAMLRSASSSVDCGAPFAAAEARGASHDYDLASLAFHHLWQDRPRQSIKRIDQALNRILQVFVGLFFHASKPVRIGQVGDEDINMSCFSNEVVACVLGRQVA